MALNSYKFSPVIMGSTSLNRSVIDLLPGVNQTATIQRFFSSSANHLFTPGSGVALNGYIGDIPAWNDSSTDYYVAEPTTGRKFYQLSPAMVSLDADTNSYTNILFYEDLINQLSFQGSLVDNQSRLFDQEFYTWCPYIDLDKFINYRKYWWVEKTSSVPDYLTISPTSLDENPWSTSNAWVHEADLSDDQKTISTQAVRPIVEFLPNIELFNYGRYRRFDTDYLETAKTDIQSYTGKKTITVNNIDIPATTVGKNGVRILVTNDIDSDSNNKIYLLAVLNNKFIVTTESDGQDAFGTPTLGEVTKVLKGDHANNEYWFDGSDWILAQSKNSTNQTPLFNLYDFNGVSLSNTNEYPSSNFNGSRLFSYNVGDSESAVSDSVMGFPLTYDVNGQIQFCDYLAQEKYSYVLNSVKENISGYYFYNILSSDGLSDELSNDWRKSPYTSRQMVVDQFTANGLNKAFTLSQVPDADTKGQLSNISVRVSTQGSDNVSKITYSYLTPDVDYIRDGNVIVIQNLSQGDNIEVKTYSSSAPNEDYDGFYEIPMNLESNPTNDPINLVTLGDVYNQFTGIMENQIGFIGQVYNINNWRSLTSYDLTLGTSIVQNSASLLPLMLTCSDSDIDVPASIRFASDSYSIFRNKFEIKITEYFKKGTYSTDSGQYSEWVDAALSEISMGLTNTSPFFNSQMAVTSDHSTSYFIPPTPSFLGLYKIYKPEIMVDYTIPTNPTVILGHDGSMTVAFGDFRDQVILELENRIYQSIPTSIRNRINPPLNIDTIVSNGTYKSEYSRSEYLSTIQSEFDRFSTTYNLDRTTNRTYNASNPFSYNWSNVQSNIDGSMLPGSWRAIFNYYYGTDRPHTNPWEMLGFTIKPSWWDNRYGTTTDPNISNPQNYYTSNNKILWNDIKEGYIAEGDNQGYHPEYAREYIYSYIPVDEQGYLLDPFQAGIAKNYPQPIDAMADWNFGDQGSSESLWVRSPSYAFARVLSLYLMKPGKFMGMYWDSLNYSEILKGTSAEQQINASLGERDQFDQLEIHGEVIDNTFIQRYGVQQFISNFLMNSNKDITTYLGKTIRGLGVRLGHKMAGFTDSSDITVSTDTNDIIPTENISVVLYRSPAIKKSFYSGVIVKRSNRGWVVYGFDNINPIFQVIPPNTNNSGETLNVGSVKANMVRTWKPNTYYPKGIIARTDTGFFLCMKSHTSSQVFEAMYWQVAERQNYSLENSAIWYNYGNSSNTVKKVPYGTEFKTVQEVVNFLNGLQRFQSSDGWVFETVSDTGTILDWKSSAQQFMNWHLDYASENSFISLSPMSESVSYNTDQGEIQNVEQIINGQYGIVDKTGTPIEPYNVIVSRDDGAITLQPNSSMGIFGTKLYVSSLEHVLIFNNSTVFGDVIYNPVMNVRQPRLKLQGYKTDKWNGRLEAPGFVISGNTLIPNFEKTTDDFRHLFDIESLDNDSLQERARANIGFFERSYMTNLSMSSTNQLEFYMGMIQDKGTPTVFKRLMRSDFIRNNKNISYHEEWAFRVGTYGADEIRPSMDFSITHADITNDPQLITFNTTEVHDRGTFDSSIIFSNNQSGTFDFISSEAPMRTVDITSIKISIADTSKNSTGSISLHGALKGVSVDLLKSYDTSSDSSMEIDLSSPITLDSKTITYSTTGNSAGTFTIELEYQISSDSYIDNSSSANVIEINDFKSVDSGKYIVKDDRWIQRLGVGEIDWPTQTYDVVTPEFFPNAGYVNVDTVQWTSPTANKFYTLYSDILTQNSPENFNVTYNYTQKGNSGRVVDVELIKSQQSGYFRVNFITIKINKAPLIATTINIGTAAQLPSNPENNDYSATVISRITNEDLTGTSSSITLYPSSFWMLDGSNNGIRLQISSLDTSAIPSSITIADISITLDVDWITDSILPGDRSWVYNMGVGDWETFSLFDSGYKINSIKPPSFEGQGSVTSIQGYQTNPENTLSSDSILVLDGVQSIEPDILEVLTPVYSNSVSVLIDGSSLKTALLDFSTDAGMIIDNLSINVLKPFSTTDGTELVFDIGTEVTNTLLTQSNVLSNPVPTVPDFSASVPVTVKLANQSIVIADSTQTVKIHVVRYGNIYGVPQTCSDLLVSSVNWYYSPADATTGAATNWVLGGTLTFGNPQNSTDIQETYWHLAADFDFVADSGNYLIKLDDPVNAIVDSANSISTITADDPATTTTFDPTTVGSQTVNTDLFNINNDDGTLYVVLSQNTTGLAVVTLSYHYTNGFELFTVDSKPYSITDPGYGGNVLSWAPTRYNTVSAAMTSSHYNNLSDGTYFEIDDNGSGSWIICRKDSTLETIWTQQPKIISGSLNQAVLYDNNSSQLEQALQIYDPYKGFIPDAAAIEIKYIMEYDPAIYNYDSTGPYSSVSSIWGKEQAGLLWWDISTVRYLDYENIDLEYRWKHWGELCPGTSVDIYEWVRSPVPPTSWNAYIATGSTSNGFDTSPSGSIISDTPSWVEINEWSDVLQKMITVYYFWVLSPTTVPSVKNRTISATGITDIILDPKSNNIPYYAVVSSNSLILGNIKEYVSTNSSIKIKWDIGKNEGNFHKQWCILREGDDGETMDTNLWKKMSDSLVGYDTATTLYEVYGVTNDDIIPGNNDISITITDGTLSSIPTTGEMKVGEFWLTYNHRVGTSINGVTNNYGVTFKANSPIYFRETKFTPNAVPDPTLSSSEALGNLIRPMQSWFPAANGIASRNARTVFVDIMNTIFSTAPYVDNWYNWQDMLESSDPVPDATLYGYEAPDFQYRNQMVTNNLISQGSTVLVPGQASTNGFWTVWQYNPSHPQSDAEGFVLINAQRWRLQEGEFWEYMDWYATGWSADDFPMYRFDTLSDRDSTKIDVTLLNGTLVEVKNTDAVNPRWVRYIYTDAGWTEVAKEKATFKILPSFYENTDVYGYNGFDLSKIDSRDGSRELKWILDNMINVMSNSQIMDVFFTMVRYAVSVDSTIDWAFKTSFMYLGGYEEQLNQEPVAFVDQMDNITSFIEEVKPYHVKIRDYISVYSAGPDVAYTHATDFDFPVYNDPALNDSKNRYRILSPITTNNTVMSNPSSANQYNDTVVASGTFPWADWYNNYSLTDYDIRNWSPSRNPIRHMNVEVKFDRIVCDATTGWDPVNVPWDAPITIYDNNGDGISSSELFDKYRSDNIKTYTDIVVISNDYLPQTSTKNGNFAYSVEDRQNFMWIDGKWVAYTCLEWDVDTEGGEAARIVNYYEPTNTMAPKELDCLLVGCGFSGTLVEGGPIEQGLWDMFPWDENSGWANEFAYYDGGIDTKSTIPTHSTQQPVGSTMAISDDVRGRDFDVQSLSLTETPDLSTVLVDGGKIVNPRYASGNPEEAVPVQALASLIMIITDKDADKFSMTYGNMGSWELVKIVENNVTIVSDDSTSITLSCPDGFTLHDPANPSTEYLDLVKASYVDTSVTEEEQNKILGRLQPGSILVQVTDGSVTSWERIQYWDVLKNTDGTYTIGALQRNYNGMVLRSGKAYSMDDNQITSGSKVYDMSIVNWLTPDNQQMKLIPRSYPDIRYQNSTRNGKKVWTYGGIVMCPQ